ncbi:MAG: caspase family protein [Burkholderiales bacterium]|uniref:caspase family protein n=1 Tax=Inhella sp. TaxID=1921806 RepID=UPI001ACCD859|nr:caspase family protein [Burkholderiales bacterium]
MATTQPKAMSLHIGVNVVNAAHYAGWEGPLTACEFDAKDMAALALGQGIKPTTLLTRNATRAKVLTALRAAAKALKKGDYFMLTFSGHGGQVPDVDNEEADERDETWCLYDGQLIDDELYLELTGFAAGVRILMLSDSCHSGTVAKNGPPGPFTAPSGPAPRWMPFTIGERVYRQNKTFYDRLQRECTKASGGRSVDPDEALANVGLSGRVSGAAKQMKASVILIAGCQDNQSSYDGEHNGAFTEALLATWDQGKFKGNHAQLHRKTRARLPDRQSPNLFTLGPAKAFLAQRPFAV